MPKKPIHGPVRNPRRGRLIRILTIAFAFASLITIFAISDTLGLSRSAEDLALKASILVLIGVCFLAYNFSRRYEARSGEDVMADDPRPPVIYLRSFVDDPKANGAEISLAQIMEDVGPFVAIGEPEEELPPLGASRMYVSTGNWKKVVSGLLNKASLVFLAAGRTPGLGWEISRCRSLLGPARLVVLVPADEAMYCAFVARANASGAKIRLPDLPAGHKRRIRVGGGVNGYFCGIVCFDRKWRGRFQPFVRAAFRGSNPQFPLAKTGRDDARLRLALQRCAQTLELPIEAPGTNYPYMAVLFFSLTALGALVATSIAIATGISKMG